MKKIWSIKYLKKVKILKLKKKMKILKMIFHKIMMNWFKDLITKKINFNYWLKKALIR